MEYYIITDKQLAKLDGGTAKARHNLRNQIQSDANGSGEAVQVGRILRRMAPIDRGVAIEQGQS